MSKDKKDIVNDSTEEVEEIEEEAMKLSESDSKKIDLVFPKDKLLNAVSLPEPVRRRIKALKLLQLKFTNIEAKFYEEVHRLECKYNSFYHPLYAKREEIVTGCYEPTNEECELPDEIEDKFGEMCLEFSEKAAIEQEVDENTKVADESLVGIPDFWLTIFKNVGMLNDMIRPHDEPILKHLIDVKVLFLEENPMGFVIEFHFSPNEFFSNSVLTKEYIMKCEPEKNDPFGFEGPEIYRCKGCVIDWHKGKNVTVKMIRKKQKHKSKGSVRTVTKTVPNDSFFNFFTPPYVPEDQDASDLDEDTHALLTSDFEIGHYIRERIIPKAVLYYTGEALEDEEEFDEECMEEEEDDSSDENDGNDGSGTNVQGNRELKQQLNDCKQQ